VRSFLGSVLDREASCSLDEGRSDADVE